MWLTRDTSTGHEARIAYWSTWKATLKFKVHSRTILGTSIAIFVRSINLASLPAFLMNGCHAFCVSIRTLNVYGSSTGGPTSRPLKPDLDPEPHPRPSLTLRFEGSRVGVGGQSSPGGPVCLHAHLSTRPHEGWLPGAGCLEQLVVVLRTP